MFIKDDAKHRTNATIYHMGYAPYLLPMPWKVASIGQQTIRTSPCDIQKKHWTARLRNTTLHSFSAMLVGDDVEQLGMAESLPNIIGTLHCAAHQTGPVYAFCCALIRFWWGIKPCVYVGWQLHYVNAICTDASRGVLRKDCHRQEYALDADMPPFLSAICRHNSNGRLRWREKHGGSQPLSVVNSIIYPEATQYCMASTGFWDRASMWVLPLTLPCIRKLCYKAYFRNLALRLLLCVHIWNEIPKPPSLQKLTTACRGRVHQVSVAWSFPRLGSSLSRSFESHFYHALAKQDVAYVVYEAI